MTQAEFSAHVSCLDLSAGQRQQGNVAPIADAEALPATVNWVTTGAVTPIKN